MDSVFITSENAGDFDLAVKDSIKDVNVIDIKYQSIIFQDKILFTALIIFQ